MLLRTFVEFLSQASPELYSTLASPDLIRFTALAAEVKARAEGAWTLSPESAHEVTPFLRTALGLSLPSKLCRQLWHSICPILPQSHVQPDRLIQQHGYRPELPAQVPEHFLLPPVKHCVLCPAQTIKLQHRSQIDSYLYDIDGVHTTRIFTMKCPTECKTHYRPSYFSMNKVRTYYSTMEGRNPAIFQVSCHYFMTHRLAEFFRNGQMLAHISNFNLVNLFNLSYTDDFDLPALIGAPMVQPVMSENTCKDGLDIHSLLLRADSSDTHLTVDTKEVESNQRYHRAMQRVLERIALEGTTHRNHVCSACFRLVTEPSDVGTNPKVKGG
ncbi:uncharacterized protein MELLADRAFT_89422 [Melampsora larici-populina 98AG31]|uniref:CxC5 like cysteine cluster associated with KDZ domain-containing protein n=1 Tax=Melampsora larici-populina (strain 98AG31 / pathotype 3-4-7) TaxID=747676 RepID=F4SE92_MELLP|nr:uncharacterized protein MELLADRAFT_89422 [Melampsora larici-populina 98AG31]EGF97036.1 hypothetical protein MELLADRAFT_89422 [Melampsora larici-populina 98AG31]